jgi:hypothetical protein
VVTDSSTLYTQAKLRWKKDSLYVLCVAIMPVFAPWDAAKMSAVRSGKLGIRRTLGENRAGYAAVLPGFMRV